MTVQESIQAIAEDMAEVREAVGYMQTAVAAMRDKGAATSSTDLRPEMAEIQKQMAEIKETIAAIQSPAPPAGGEGASTYQILIIACFCLVAVAGMEWYHARAVKEDIEPIYNGIYTTATPESPRHSAVPWSASWQNEQNRRARIAAEQAQASEGMEEEEEQ